MIAGSIRLGVVTGLAEEARIARVMGQTRVGGGSSWGAELAAEQLVAQGATALLSFGVCGGLSPHLRAGDLIVPLAIVETGASYPTDGPLSSMIGAPIHGILASSETIVATRDAKRRLFIATRASAVDLESGAVARVALRHGLPFTALRAVCDAAFRSLPPAALVPLDCGGKVSLRRVMRSVATRPGQIPDLLKLSHDASLARRALVKAARSLAAKGMVNS